MRTSGSLGGSQINERGRKGAISPAPFTHYYGPDNAVFDVPAPVAPLDKLAQPRTKSNQTNISISEESLRKLSRNKYLTNGLVFQLVRDEFSPMRKSYWNSFHCSRELEQKGKRVSGHYCKNRWCIGCNRIRTGILINGYLPQLEKMNERMFVTLTQGPTVKKEDLPETIQKMHDVLKLIRDKYRKRKTPLVGLRKLECTYNLKDDLFHPHFHIIMEGEALSNDLLIEWLAHFPGASSWAQKSVKADLNSCRELFKYFTKLVTKKNGSRGFHPQSLDIIFQAMKGRRVFQPMGIRKINEDQFPESQEYVSLPGSYNTFIFDDKRGNYIGRDGIPISDFFPSPELKFLRGDGIPEDWRILDNEFKAINRFDQRKHWEERTEYWNQKTERMRKNSNLVDRIFKAYLEENSS